MSSELLDFIRFFLLHAPVSLERVVELVSIETCQMLLDLGAVTAVRGQGAEIVPMSEVLRALAKSDCDGMKMISNVQIWPVQDDVLVASDWQQTVTIETK